MANSTARDARRRLRLTSPLALLSSGAILAVFAAGYARTESAASTLEATPVVSGAVAAVAAAEPVRPTVGILATPSATFAPPTRPAPSATPLPSATATPRPATALRDGVFAGSGTSRHGGMEVTLTIQGGKIVRAEITSCRTRYSCSRVSRLPGQVVERQSAGVDVISGATDSSRAFQGAVATAACLRDAAAGMALLGACGVAGLLVDAALGLHATQDLQGLLPC